MEYEYYKNIGQMNTIKYGFRRHGESNVTNTYYIKPRKATMPF